MSKVNIKTVIWGCIGVVFMLAVAYAIYVFIQRMNGTTPAQIETQRRAEEAAKQTEKALDEQSQWHRELMSGPTIVINSDGK